MIDKYWAHFIHDADIGVRGVGNSKEEAFEQAALALTAVITDPENVEPKEAVTISCEAPDDALLFTDYLNALIYEMATRKMLFGSFELHLDGHQLHARAQGERVDVAKHEPAVEVKGATYTDLEVKQEQDGTWIAQCVVDV
jgi:tRNA nucleotidyltransferase (CCA-adding enzyme)